MRTLFRNMISVLRAPVRNVRALYDRAAPRYEYFRRIWLKLAGEKTERALIRDLARLMRSGVRVLDAGSGTGALSRQILRLEPSVRLISLDQSLPMLRGASECHAARIQGDVVALPFAGGTFDIVVSDWVLETVPNRGGAVAEYLRVLAPGGWVLYTFCSLPAEKRWRSALLRAAVGWSFAGRFLTESDIPVPRTEHFGIRRFHGGLASLVVGRKR
jgi:ubiquinone/menaquinone biosynthesis C-methylase UbiE